MLSHKEQSILSALERRAQQEGIEVLTVEIVGSSRNPIIRVYLDTEDGISFDEVTAAQPWVDEIMEQIDPFPGAYTLEVSTPGIDRPLRTLDHFRRVIGQQATVLTREPVEGRSKFKGTLESVSEDGLIGMSVDGQHYDLPHSALKKAHVNGAVNFS
ncbi:MAG: ribosome maturation factor RimP [Eggerthellales bacterium]|nr:ribosome maturation factor RimP [Eggerthellales bacterium]